MEFISVHIAVYLAMFFGMLFVSPQPVQQESSQTVSTAAKQAFDRGEQELADGNLTGAITLLKTAVRLQPQNASYQHKLAKCYLAAEKYQPMWIHLRKAAMLDPTNQEYAQDFLRMWRFHDLQGTINVGTPEGIVLKSLGEPDKIVEASDTRRLIYAFMAVDCTEGQDQAYAVAKATDLRGLTEDAARAIDRVDVSIDPAKWKVAHHQVSKSSENIEFTTNGEQIQNWSELFSQQRFPGLTRAGGSPSKMFASIRNSLLAIDAAAEVTVISESPNEILYHWVISAKQDNPAQHEIAKIIKGRNDLYRVAYVKKTKRLSPTEFSTWKTIIGNSSLVPVVQPKADSNNRLWSWQLGKNLAFASLLRAQQAPDEAVKSVLLKMSSASQSLKVSIPAPDKLTGDVNADTAAAIEFLLSGAGKPVFNDIQNRFGNEQAALFELAIKSTLLTFLYQPGDSMSQSLATAIKRSAVQADLEESIWQPLLSMVQEEATRAELSDAVKNFQMKVAGAITQ